MTAAQRMRRHRAKQRASKLVTKTIAITKDEAAEIVAGLLLLARQRRKQKRKATPFTATLYDLLRAYTRTANRRARRNILRSSK
jgi:hypothetical protein